MKTVLTIRLKVRILTQVTVKIQIPCRMTRKIKKNLVNVEMKAHWNPKLKIWEAQYEYGTDTGTNTPNEASLLLPSKGYCD